MAPDFLTLLRVGFTEPIRSPGPLVVSYTTVSPLPLRGLDARPARRPSHVDLGTAVCSLWHFPAGHPGWLLATTLPCGARTFLGAPPVSGRCDAVARPAHPWASVTAPWRAGQSQADDKPRRRAEMNRVVSCVGTDAENSYAGEGMVDALEAVSP